MVSVTFIFMCPSILKHHESFSNICNHAVSVYALVTKKVQVTKLYLLSLNIITLKNIKTSERELHTCKKMRVKCTMFILLQMSEFFPQILF